MKNAFTRRGAIPEWTLCILLALVCAGIHETAAAQASYPITSVSTTGTTNSAAQKSFSNVAAATGTLSSGLAYTYNFTYGTPTASVANNVTLNSFVANSQTFTYSGINPTVIFRRVNINITGATPNVVTGNRVNMWYERVASNNNLSTGSGTGNGGTAALLPDYTDVLETLFAGRHFNLGIDNVFQNSVTTNNNNIKRMDVVFMAGLQATDVSKVGFAVFDRGSDGTNDPFKIAAIKTIDGTGKPLSYYPPVYISASNMYGSAVTPSTAINYHIMRKEQTDANLKIMNPNQGPQNRNGVFLTFGQLGIAVANTTYGYSLFGPDVTYTSGTDIVDWTNTSHFPGVSDLGSTGGLDMVAVTGVAYTNSSFLIALPVRIDDFGALITGAKVQLNWQLGATDQLNTAVIERSGDGVGFSSLLSFSVPEAGPQTAYDEQPLAGANYYRMKLTGYDGAAVAYSTISRVDLAVSGLISLNIYPNPVKGRQFTLEVRGLQNKTYTLRLLDMNGKIMFGQEFNGTTLVKKEILLSGGLSAGTYTLRLADKDGEKVLIKTIMLQ